jgi:hypothetical protein
VDKRTETPLKPYGATMGNARMYEAMLEAPGLLRSRQVRLSLVGTVKTGQTLHLDDSDWIVTDTAPTKSEELSLRLVARRLTPTE